MALCSILGAFHISPIIALHNQSALPYGSRSFLTLSHQIVQHYILLSKTESHVWKICNLNFTVSQNASNEATMSNDFPSHSLNPSIQLYKWTLDSMGQHATE
jgi:hypothetical protein